MKSRGCAFMFLNVSGGFLFDGRSVAACQQAFVVESVDLAFQSAA